jgi:3-isopropylmalate/(R)-2-methylmalate dehydratase small subunit
MDTSKRTLNPDFILNQTRYQGAQILLARSNFGCGSSREHAPWALQDYGFRVVIAPSFADIFFSNCFKIGLLPIVLGTDSIDRIFSGVESAEGYSLTVNLEDQTVTTPNGEICSFDTDPFRRHCLLNGLDEIGLTLQHTDKIIAFEQRRRTEQPWLFK